MADINGSAADDSLDGTTGADIFFLQAGGNDSARGGEGEDGFFFGNALTSADSVDGGTGTDSLALQGDYAAGLALGDIRNVETLVFLSGSDTRFGEAGSNRYSYNVTSGDQNVGAGLTQSVIATGLLAGENLVFDGSAESDGNFRIYAGTGIDVLTGGAGSDGFFFGADGNLTGEDRIDGGLGIDTLALRGDYVTAPFLAGAVQFQDGSFTGIEVLALLSGHTNEYSGVIVPGGYRYQLIMAEGNVASGQRLDVNASGLRSDESVWFDGQLETDGSYRILAGAGADTLSGSQSGDLLYGGLGADSMTGNGGPDVFAYRGASESTAAATDDITDFSASDTIDLTGVDANSLAEGVQSFSFIGTTAFGATAGQLRAVDTGNSVWRLEGDVDGDGTADLVIRVKADAGHVLASTNSLVTAILPPPPGQTPVVAELEPNNGPGTAQTIDRGLLAVADNADLLDDALPSVTIRGEIDNTADVDFFSINLIAGERLILDVDHVPVGTLDALVRVYAPNGTLIWENDDPDLEDSGSSSVGAYFQDPHVTDSLIAFRAVATGTYTFSIGAFQADNPAETGIGGYDLNLSVAPPASLAQILSEDVDALISSAAWPTTDLTFSFPTSAADYPDYPANSEPYNNFRAFNLVQQAVVRANFERLASFSDLSFTELASDRGSAILRYGMSDEPDTAYAFYPTTDASGGIGDPIGGDSWYRVSGGRYSNPVLGNYAFVSIIHETGHALGLKHGQETPFALTPERDSLEYSVMTYRSYPGADLEGYRNETFGYPQSYMMFDIAALQRMYGADFTTNAGDTVYGWNPNSGQMSINGVGQATPGANRVFLTIWDGGGNDTYDLSNYGNAVTLDLRPGEWTTTSPIQLANLGIGNIARGNVANALLFEGDPRSLIENGIGGAGGDILIANQAVNRLTGNGGGDIFRWAAASDSAPGEADIVVDFLSGNDRIDLSPIDADSRTAGDDSFHWIGSAAFSGAAGEVRGEVIGANLHIFADANADMVADFEIVLANQTAIAPSDFIF